MLDVCYPDGYEETTKDKMVRSVIVKKGYTKFTILVLLSKISHRPRKCRWKNTIHIVSQVSDRDTIVRLSVTRTKGEPILVSTLVVTDEGLAVDRSITIVPEETDRVSFTGDTF